MTPRLIVVALVLAGCATAPRMTAEEAATGLDDNTLCYIAHDGLPFPKRVAQAELTKRGNAPCSPEQIASGKATIEAAQLEQQRREEMAAAKREQWFNAAERVLKNAAIIGGAILLAPTLAPPPPPPPRPITCYTTGNGQVTTCQ